jgi:hypothetical protein
VSPRPFRIRLRHTSTQTWSRRADPAVSSLDEFDAEASILLVGVAIPWHGWSIKVIERHEEPHRGAVFGDQVLQHEEFDVAPEVLEQREKVAVPRQRLTEWAVLDDVVPALTRSATPAFKHTINVAANCFSGIHASKSLH